jgi:hypothetical protein
LTSGFRPLSCLALSKHQIQFRDNLLVNITEESEYNPPDQALTWTFHFTQIQDSTASIARQFFCSCPQIPKTGYQQF